MMKRQRGVGVNVVKNPMNGPRVEAVAAMGKKKTKKEGEKKVVEEEKEERNESIEREVEEGTGDEAVKGFSWEENMPWLGGVVDEQMSWGSTWFPGWDMDFMGEAFSTALYSDVVWDDDIWNLNNEIPIPLHCKRFY